MKSLVSYFTIFLLSVVTYSQAVWIADNRPNSPSGDHIFPSVGEAIAAASPGDIIHITPSQFSYGNWTINKDSLTIFGIGYNPDKEQPAISNNGTVTIALETFGIRISGLRIDQLTLGSSSSGSIGNVFIENSRINSIEANVCCSVTSLSNIIIRNCILGRDFVGADYIVDIRNTYVSSTSVVIANNIITNSSTTSSGGYGAVNVSDAIIKNNLFIGNDSGNDFAFNNVSTSTISNNIFYGTRPITDGITGSVFNSTFSNNVSFGNNSTSNSFPIGISGNTGDSTFVDTDPLFVNVPLGNENWDFGFDPSLQGGSPAIGAGNDGGDIGVTGGTIPYSRTGSPLPVIKVLRLPEIIQEGTNTNATIEAQGN
ncbi:MAG: hypothetical protein HRT61_05295 [Ekhidna sp.]|nr:hypothetical protein [Ekhidna sp.]